jgi:uracil-DNA glycosylase family 4
MDVPDSCAECGRYKFAKTAFMTLYGDVPCDVLFVGESPGDIEDRLGRPFWPTAPSGKKLEEICRQVGLNKYRRAYTNGVRCWAPDPMNPRKRSKTPTPQEVTACRSYVLDDIARAEPKLVILLGAVALRAALNQTNITRKRGTVIQKDGLIYLASWHPSYVLRDPRYEPDFIRDLQQGKLLLEQQSGSETVVDRLRKKYVVIKTKDELHAMVAKAMTRPFLGFDTEFYPLDAIERPRRSYGVTIAWVNDDGTIESYFVPGDHPESPFLNDPEVKETMRLLLISKPLDTHNAEADVETAVDCYGIKTKELTLGFDSMAASLALHGPASSHQLKTLIMTEAPDLAGYEQELDTFKEESKVHRGTLLRLTAIDEQLAKLEEKRRAQADKHPTRAVKPYKKTEDLEQERRDLEPARKAAIAFIKKHGTIFDGDDYGTIPLAILSNPYATGDGEATLRLKQKYKPRIRSTEQQAFFDKVLNRSWRLNMEMRRNGMLLDWGQWKYRFDYFNGESNRLLTTLRELPDVAPYITEVEANGKQFSLHPSSNDLPNLLFTVLNLPPPSYKTDSGSRWAMDKNALLEIKAQRAHPIIDLLIEKGSIDKSLSTYVEGWIQKYNKKGNRVLYEDGRVHPRFHNFIESTRRGTSAPNSQNVPIGDPKSPIAKKIRAELEATHPQGDLSKKAWEAKIDKLLQPLLPDNMRMLVRAAPGYKLVQSDYGQLEFRLAACYSGDPTMLDGCRKGDPHGAVQERFRIRVVNDETILDPTGELLPRIAAKRINFGIIYGCEAERLQEIILETCGLKWTVEFCQEIIDGMWALYPNLRLWIDQTHTFIKENGYIRNAIGKIRHLPHAQHSDDRYVAERACREGLNDTCQSLGHNILDVAMNELLDFIWKNNLDWRLNNDQHDGYLMEVPEAQVQEAAIMSKYFMESVPKKVLKEFLQCPLEAEIKTGDHWGNLDMWKAAA